MNEKCIICKAVKPINLFELTNSTEGSVCIECYQGFDNKELLHELYDAYYIKGVIINE